MKPATARHNAGKFIRYGEPQTVVELLVLAKHGSRKDRRAALRDLRRMAAAPAKK